MGCDLFARFGSAGGLEGRQQLAVVEELFAILRRLNEETGVAMLIVEQNAALALELAEHAYLLETGHIVMDAPAEVIGADESIRRAYLGY